MFNIDNREINIFLDKYGNFYLDDSGIYYQLNIDAKNNPYLEKYNYKILNDTSSEYYSSKNKFKKNIKLFPCKNDKEYIILDDTTNSDDNLYYPDIEDKYGYHNKPFKIYIKLDNIKIYDIEDSDICALYDIILYKNDSIILISRSYDESSVYEILIYDDNIIEFKLLGDKKKYYNIISCEGNLCLNQVDSP